MEAIRSKQQKRAKIMGMKLPLEVFEMVLKFIPSTKAVIVLGCREQELRYTIKSPWINSVESNCLPALNWLYRVEEPIVFDLLAAICLKGSLDMMKWFFARYPYDQCL